jgi:hypothetical protein
MMKYLAIILMAYSANVAFGQQTETRAIGSFSGVKASEGIDVYLKKGDKESVRVEVTKGNVSDVITEISGSYLRVHMRDGSHKNTAATVHVTYVKVDKLSASSAGSIFAEGTIKATTMEVSASSAGTVDVSIDTDNLETNASSAGDIELKGKARSIEMDASSAGQIDAYDLEAEKVRAEASSGGSIKLFVTKDLVAHASSGAGIRFRGNPDKQITNSSSGGSVKKSN